MIPALATMIAAYIVFRAVEIGNRKDLHGGTRTLAVLVILVAFAMTIWIWVLSSEPLAPLRDLS